MNNKISTSLVASLLLATNLYSNETLDTITVTSATKSTQSIKDVTSNIDVITKEEIEEKNFTSVIEALNTISGISYNSHGSLGSSSSVYLRGMSNLRTLVLIDGVRFQDPSNTTGANFSHLMINDIERIEIIKGAQSGIWGSEAAAGVINIITKDTQKDTHANVNLEAGSFNTKKFATTISHGTKDFDVKFGVNRITSDGFTSVLSYGDKIDDYEKDGYRNTTLSLNTNLYLTDNDKLNINIKDINGLTEYDKRNSPDNEDMESDIDNRLYSVNYSHKVAKHDIKLKYQLSKFDRHEIGTTSSPGFTYNGTYYPGSANVLKFNGETQNVELTDEISYFKDSFLLFGLGNNIDKVDYIMTDDTKEAKNSKSKYIHLTNSNKFNDIVLTESLRYDNYKNFDNKLTGKIGLKYDHTNNLSFSSNIGTGYNVPSIIKEFNPWGTSNFELEPEETKSFDIGTTYHGLSLTYFKSNVDNLIDWDTGGYKNVDGTSKFRGVEIGYKDSLNDDTLISMNYTHLSAKDADEDNLVRRAKRTLNYSLDYYGFNKLHMNVNGQYIGSRKDSGNVETGRYTLWNTVLNYKINKNLNTYIKVNNVFNKYYQTSLGYATAPRSGYIGLNYTF